MAGALKNSPGCHATGGCCSPPGSITVFANFSACVVGGIGQAAVLPVVIKWYDHCTLIQTNTISSLAFGYASATLVTVAGGMYYYTINSGGNWCQIRRCTNIPYSSTTSNPTYTYGFVNSLCYGACRSGCGTDDCPGVP